LVEILGPETRVVVKYDRSHLRLLGAFHTETRTEPSHEELERVARASGLKLGIVDSLPTVASIKRSLETLRGHEQEGWVVQFKDGSRRKFKGENYLALHRSRSDVTPLRIWQILASCPKVDEAEATLREHAQLMPEEHFKDAMDMGRQLLIQHQALQQSLERDIAETAGLSDKHLGKAISQPNRFDVEFSLPAKARGLLFLTRNRPDDVNLWKYLKPKPKTNL
jgi:hypothetical protein